MYYSYSNIEEINKKIINEFYDKHHDSIKICQPEFYFLFLKEYSLLPLQYKLIFPDNIGYYETYTADGVCLRVFSKFEYFYNYISIWSSQDYVLIEFLIYIAKDNIYFLIELLIGLSHMLAKNKFVNNNYNLEQIIGRVFGYYISYTNACVKLSAKIVDSLTKIFSFIEIPKKELSNDSAVENYFDNMARFYYGLFMSIKPEKAGEIMYYLNKPLTYHHSKLSKPLLKLYNMFESLFLVKLFKKLNYNLDDKYLFISSWDEYGFFMSYLYACDKLGSYGLKLKDELKNINIEEAIELELKRCDIIAHFFEKL